MDGSIRPASPLDIFVWPDGTTITRENYDEIYEHYMGDDFRVVPVGSEERTNLTGVSV